MPEAPRPDTVILGDAIEVMRGWPDGCVDHCIADPPFNIGGGSGRGAKSGLGWAFSSHVTMQESWDRFGDDDFFRFNLAWLEQVCRVVKPNGNILVFGTYHNIYQIGFILKDVLKRRINNAIVWYKPNAQPNITARMLTESTEQIAWAVNETPERAKGWTFNYWKAKELAGGRQMRTLWEFPVTARKERGEGGHPSQKPLALVERLMDLVTSPDDLIVDPFGGAGTLGVAAVGLGRRYVLVESVEAYAAYARQRIGEATKA
jgi:DNA modification methylase